MNSVASLATVSVVPGSREAWRDGRERLIPVTVSMRFALLCLRTTIPMAVFPFRRTERTGSG